ncbi:MAG: hypothetical protein ACYDCL_21150 [Myxococcales bacterium]
MRRALLLGVLAACAHVPSEPIATPSAPTVATVTGADVSWEEARAALLSGRLGEAGHLFGAFAEAFPDDGRAPLARLQQAWATLAADPDAARATEHAAALLDRLRPGKGSPEELSELRALLEARRRRLEEAQGRTADLAACRKQLQSAGDLERDRAAAKAAVAKLQQELARKERALEDVKQRLLEIQQLAAEMLGVPKPGSAPKAATPPAKAP